MAISLENKMQLWIKRRWNCLLIGKAGTGKTTLVKEAFEVAKLKYKIFSASTLDPFLELIGIPKEAKDENNISYIHYIKPRVFAYDEVEAIFFDEFNRGHKKIRNFVLELIQFKSINGEALKNLKIVWAAINPEDDELQQYDVEPLDPAQKDRFHIHYYMPYEIPKDYFTKKYKSASLTKSITEYWNKLTKEQKNLLSPRRLDYALEVHFGYGDITDVVPKQCNPELLKLAIKSSPCQEELNTLFNNKDTTKAKEFLEDEGNYETSIPYLTFNESWATFFVPLLPKEKISLLISESEEIKNVALKIYKDSSVIKEVLDDIVNAGTNAILVAKIDKQFTKDKDTQYNLIAVSDYFNHKDNLVSNEKREKIELSSSKMRFKVWENK